MHCLITWLVGVLIDVPNLIGWGGHYYDYDSLSCVWDRTVYGFKYLSNFLNNVKFKYLLITSKR